MRFCSLVALAVLGACTTVAPTVMVRPASPSATHEMAALPVHIGGRVSVDSLPNGAKAYRHEWPGVYFEAAFRGDRVTLRFNDPANAYRLLIDDLPVIPLAQLGAAEATIGGFTGGDHRLRLEKVTESIGLVESFEGFYVPRNATPLPAPPRKRQIEFIGDSGMTGYGVHSATRQCTNEEVRLRTDTQAAYPALVARHFGADYQVNAISGRGLVRNYAGEAPDAPMTVLHPRALFSEEGIWHDESWQPQIIVIGLFANDFSTPLKPGEKWASEVELAASFVAAYRPFLAELHRRVPNAAVLVVWPETTPQLDMQRAAMIAAAQRSITASAEAVGFRIVLFPVLPDLGFDNTACDYHASLADHRKLEVWLTAYIEARPELWQGK